MDPGTAMLIATAVAAATKGASDYLGGQSEQKAAKRRAKETKRETYATSLDEALNRGAKLEAHRLGNRAKSARRRSQSSAETSDLVRGALNI